MLLGTSIVTQYVKPLHPSWNFGHLANNPTHC